MPNLRPTPPSAKKARGRQYGRKMTSAVSKYNDQQKMVMRGMGLNSQASKKKSSVSKRTVGKNK